MGSSLRRYTELPYLIDYLHTKKIALLNPSLWDDKNDSYYIERFAQDRGFKSTYALCLTEAEETYHHWRIFSHGSSGACIAFDKAKLIKAAKAEKELRAEIVNYKTIDYLLKNPPTPNKLPFLKRFAYRDEKEFRLFYGTQKQGPAIYHISIPLSAIVKISLSPWLPREVALNIKKTLKSISGCSDLIIHKSNLVENEHWKNLAK